MGIYIRALKKFFRLATYPDSRERKLRYGEPDARKVVDEQILRQRYEKQNTLWGE